MILLIVVNLLRLTSPSLVSNSYSKIVKFVFLQTFRSIQEISDAFPPKVYVQEQLTLTLASDDNSGKFVTVVLEKGDELTILNRLESPSGLGIISKVSYDGLSA